MELGWKIAGILLGTKLLATVLCYGLGGCGGIFSPTLFFGGMCGICLAGLSSLAVPLSESGQLTLAVVGMSACLGAVVRAPVTGMLIVFEMTHEFSLVPALMVGALVSQAISRKLCRHSFYEEILVQDGHQLEHVIPPRDLRSWQQLPVAAIANFHPVTVEGLEAAEIEKVLRAHPYERFPVVDNGAVKGILTRKEAQAALAGRRGPKLEPAVTCLRNQCVAELQARLIESNSMIVVLVDRPGGQVLGVVTLHDLLRAQAAMSEAAAG